MLTLHVQVAQLPPPCVHIYRTKLNYNPPKEDGSTYRIELQGISMPIMKQILDYIFSGEVMYFIV